MNENPVQEALQLTKTQLKTTPETDSRFAPLRSVEMQLEYLDDFLTKRNPDGGRLGAICVGLIAAREFEPDDLVLAGLLYRVQEFAESLSAGGSTP